jgi:hypothetical protein
MLTTRLQYSVLLVLPLALDLLSGAVISHNTLMTNAALLTTSWQVPGLLFLRFSVMDTHFLICLPCTAYTAVQKWYSAHHSARCLVEDVQYVPPKGWYPLQGLNPDNRIHIVTYTETSNMYIYIYGLQVCRKTWLSASTCQITILHCFISLSLSANYMLEIMSVSWSSPITQQWKCWLVVLDLRFSW